MLAYEHTLSLAQQLIRYIEAYLELPVYQDDAIRLVNGDDTVKCGLGLPRRTPTNMDGARIKSLNDARTLAPARQRDSWNVRE